jgi:hypothetical protein
MSRGNIKATGPDEFANRLPLRYIAALCYQLVDFYSFPTQYHIPSVVLSKTPSLFSSSERSFRTGTSSQLKLSILMRKFVPFVLPLTKLPQEPPRAELTDMGTQITAAFAPPSTVDAISRG